MRVGIFSSRCEVLDWQMRVLGEFNRTACMDVSFSAFPDMKSLLRGMTEAPFDVLLFDTERLESAQEDLLRVRQTQPYCLLALLCDSEKHAVMGYSVQAAAYWVLPMDETVYLSSFAELLRRIPYQLEHFLPVKITGVWSRIEVSALAYLESAGHTLIFHMTDGREFRMTANFRDYRHQLDSSSSLLRCHKSFVVNLSCVREWQMDSFLLMDGTSINISRPYWQIARSTYAQFVTTTPQKRMPAQPLREDDEEEAVQ